VLVLAGNAQGGQHLVCLGDVLGLVAAALEQDEPVAERIRGEHACPGDAEQVEQVVRRLLLPEPGLEVAVVELGRGVGDGVGVGVVEGPPEPLRQIPQETPVQVGHLRDGKRRTPSFGGLLRPALALIGPFRRRLRRARVRRVGAVLALTAFGWVRVRLARNRRGPPFALPPNPAASRTATVGGGVGIPSPSHLPP
jgi:hypothetical protein